MNRQPSIVDWILLGTLGLLWGSGFLFIKKAVTVFDPIQMTFLRMSISTLISLPIFLYFMRSIDWSRWKALVAIAICGYGLPNYLYALAEQNDRVSSGVAGVMNSTVPLLAMCIGVVFFRAHTTRKRVLGIVVGFLGALWLVALSQGGSSKQPAYALVCLLAAVLYAFNANIVGLFLQRFHPLSIGATAFLLTGPIYLLGAWRSGALALVGQVENRWALGCVIYLAVISTVIASAVYNWLVQKTSPAFATSVAYLFPIVSLALGSLDGEHLGWVQMSGAALVLGGLYLSRH